jgi:ribosomal protein S18 acetylase RimI-like enzyme
MTDPLHRFLAQAEPADHRYFLRDYGFNVAALEPGSAEERVSCLDRGGAITAIGRLQFLNWDTGFFGCPTGRLEGLFFSPGNDGPERRRQLIGRLTARADAAGLIHLMCRIRADDMFLAQALEENGFRLVDLMTVYTRDIAAEGEVSDFDQTLSWPLLEAWVRHMDLGRLFHDAHVDRSTAERFYIEVSRHYLNNGAHLTVHHVNGAPAGVAIGVVDEAISRGIGRRYGVLWLIIVAPEYRGAGVGARLFETFCREFGRRCDVLEIGTQLQNNAANRLYLSAKCIPRSHLCTFHRWVGSA